MLHAANDHARDGWSTRMRRIGEPNEAPCPITLRAMDHDAAVEFGLSEVEIAACEDLLDLGKQPSLYGRWSSRRLLRTVFVLVVVATGMMMVRPDAMLAARVPGWPGIFFWVAFVVMMAAFAFLVARRSGEYKAYSFHGLFLPPVDSMSAESALWRRAVEAARFAQSVMSPQEFGKVQRVLSELRYRLLDRGLDLVGEDLAAQVERLASTAFGRDQ